jgi:hypothetical protein
VRARWVAIPLLSLLAAGALWTAWVWNAGVLGYAPPVRGVAPARQTALGWPWHGAVHVHTVASGDASGTVGEIAEEAKAVGLDFVVISDHIRSGRAEESRRPRWVDGVLIIFAEETNLDDGHLLAIGTQPHRYTMGPTARQAISDIRWLNGTAIVAHPVATRNSWQGRYNNVGGIEIPNLAGAVERLMNGSWGPLVKATLAYPASAAATLLMALSEVPASLAMWDELTALDAMPWPRRLSIVGGVDAHGPQVLGMPTYQQAMSALTMTLWLDRSHDELADGDARVAVSRVEAALGRGHSAVIVSAAGSAPGFEFMVRRATAGAGGRAFGPGQAVAVADSEWSFTAGLGGPGNYRIELVRDGVPIASREGNELEYSTVQAGTYRVQVFRTDGPPGAGRDGATPWILSNPIYLWPRRVIVEAKRFIVPPLPGPPVTESLLAQPGWAAEADSLSMSAMGPLAEGLRWQIRIPRQEQRDIHSAVVWRPDGTRDWSRYKGLSLRLANEREWRVALQLWTRDRAGRQTTWEHVVAVLPPTSSTGVVWSSFRRLGSGDGGVVEGTLGADELASIAGMALLVTPYLMRPGTETSIDVLEFGLFGTASQLAAAE